MDKENLDFAKLESSYNAAVKLGKVDNNLELSYKQALNARKYQMEMLITNFNRLSEEDKSSVIKNASSIFDKNSILHI